MLLCPHCGDHLNESTNKLICSSGHEFEHSNGIIDILTDSTDSQAIEEELHWNKKAEQNNSSHDPNSYFNSMIIRDCSQIYKRYLDSDSDIIGKNVIDIGEIGCGIGSALTYLGNVKFGSVFYTGIDVSKKRLVIGSKRNSPVNWKTKFVRASANNKIFSDESMDIVFSAAAMHHLNLDKVLSWISKSIRRKGLLILNEPSLFNPFANIGRKMIKDFHTPGEKPLDYRSIKKTAISYGLSLVLEEGLHFLSGPMQYLISNNKHRPTFVNITYKTSSAIDRLIKSPKYSYSFIQIYKKR